MLATTNSDSPITWSSIPARRPSQRSHPATAGITITAGSSRRAMTPPARRPADDGHHSVVGARAEDAGGHQAQRHGGVQRHRDERLDPGQMQRAVRHSR